MSAENLPPRNKSIRIQDRKQREALKKSKMSLKQIDDSAYKSIHDPITNPQPSDICYGLNELTDNISALPNDIINYFTLLKEIEAKCVYTVPHLEAYIKRFLTMRKDHPKRGLLLTRIRDCIRELMPCLEEKMHVATIASDHVKKYTKRMDQAYNIVINHEIPETIRIGPMWEPCMKVSEPKSTHQQRSESRREALAAKRAKGGFEDDHENTAGEESSGPSKKSSRGSRKDLKALNTGVHKSQETEYQNYQNNTNNENNNNHKTNGSSANGASNSSRKRKSGENEQTYNSASVVVNNNNNNNSDSTSKRGKTSRRKETKKETNGSNLNASASGKSKNGGVSDSNSRGNRSKKETKTEEATSPINYDGEPVYCYCQQVSYGEMVGCDGESCEKEWFHLPCTGLKELPKGEWYCDDCLAKMKVK